VSFEAVEPQPPKGPRARDVRQFPPESSAKEAT
jgi:hypothetical protein